LAQNWKRAPANHLDDQGGGMMRAEYSLARRVSPSSRRGADSPAAQGTSASVSPHCWFGRPSLTWRYYYRWYRRCRRWHYCAAAALSGCTAAATPGAEASGPLLVVVEQRCELARASSEDSDSKHAPDGAW